MAHLIARQLAAPASRLWLVSELLLVAGSAIGTVSAFRLLLITL